MALAPELYWISGSPPAWRVMLGFVVKGVAFTSRGLDHGAGENRTPEYLALNPLGQVPTVRCGDTVIRESVAILAWLDRAFPDRPIFGRDATEAARVWQDVIVFENELRPHATRVAQGLLRGRTGEADWRNALDNVGTQLDTLAGRLDASGEPFLGGAEPMANDLWLFPTLGWIERGVEKAGDAAPALAVTLVTDRPALARWRERFAALPGITDTHPPHWRD